MIEIENKKLQITHFCSGLVINNIMLQILNLSMASKNIGISLPAFRIISIPPSQNPLKIFQAGNVHESASVFNLKEKQIYM